MSADILSSRIPITRELQQIFLAAGSAKTANAPRSGIDIRFRAVVIKIAGFFVTAQFGQIGCFFIAADNVKFRAGHYQTCANVRYI